MMIVTVDLLAVAQGNVLLIQRNKPPFQDRLVLPGGHVEESDVNLRTACAREAFEETGLLVLPQDLELLTVLDGPGRDPRPGRRISIVFFIKVAEVIKLISCQAGSDAARVVLRRFEEIKSDLIGFDHYLAIELARKLC